MNRTAISFFAIILVLASCLIAGCSSLPFFGAPVQPPTSGGANTGITGHAFPGMDQLVPFADAAATLNSQDTEGLWNDTSEMVTTDNVTRQKNPDKRIKYIRGTGLNSDGDATSWLFIVEHGTQLSFATYDKNGLRVSSSPGVLPRPDIVLDQVMSPKDLFRKNHDIIFNTSQSGAGSAPDLSLSGNRYSISSGKTSRPLVFDAQTGALIS